MREEFRALTIEEVNEKLQEIIDLINSDDESADVEELSAQVDELNERKAEIKKVAETRQALKDKVLVEGTVIKEITEPKKEEKRDMITTASVEYRDAFYSWLAGNETEEQRTVLTTPISVDGDGTNDGAAIAIPKSLDEKIWDNIHMAHPILADITTVASGVVMEVTKHTAIATRVSSKKDAATTADAESNTFVKVTLAGKDYEKYVELTYAESKMSKGALEDYLAQEISAEIGEALAKDVFAQILSDAGNSQKVTPDASTPDLFADVKTALGLAKMGGKKVIYAPANKYYEIVGGIKSGSPFNMAAVLGVEVKLDDAATKVTIVDPKAFVLNQISNVLIESDKDIKKHRVVLAGWMRAEGCLRYNKAAAYIN